MGGDFWGNLASVVIGIPLFRAGVPKYFAMAVGQLLFDCIDKVVCLILVFLIIRSLPDRFLIKLPYGKYVTTKQYREEDIEF
jgi:energy-coupling factor transport system substrate-specific component